MTQAPPRPRSPEAPPPREVPPHGKGDAAVRRLRHTWGVPTGFRSLKEINNTDIGIYYILTALLFFVLGGILAVLMRTQLAVPNNDLLGHETYNQFFTMHGTTMMFIFAVPMMEAFSVYLIPQFLGARDLPFPRLSAYGYWCYLFGGTMAFSSLFLGIAPSGGWFMYPPLTSDEYSPGYGADFWLLGIGFIEVAAVAAAVEAIVGILKFRPPGMSLDRLPIYTWYILVFALMITFGFPPLVLGDVLLEVERAFHWPFFDPDRGGDPVLWQHLFWIFGHPEVYIIFLPAAGIVSTILPTFVQRPLVGYNLVVLAAIATGFISFALWAHHMFTTGIPLLSLSFFSAASMAVAIPAGIQVFCWIATLWSGRPILKAPMLFILGFLFIFVLGGLTGVMVAAIPFDWQAHDTYFVVAHLHYVLIGGMVFPMFAGLYYWMPLVTGRFMSERIARWVFGLIFVGFNVAFFPMHLAGLRGMPRRVYTYPDDMGWTGLNMLSSVGAYMLAAGVLLFLVDMVRHARHGERAGPNPWNSGTLDWATPVPSSNYSLRSVPVVRSRYPLWEERDMWKRINDGEFYLPDAPELRRESLRTNTITGEPEQILRLPHPTWVPMIAAAFTAALFLVLIFHWWWTAAALTTILVLVLVRWAWTTEEYPTPNVAEAGRGLRLPVYLTGRRTHSYWACWVVILFNGTTYASALYAYYYLWTVHVSWPPWFGDAGLFWPTVAVGLLVASSGAAAWAKRRLVRTGSLLALHVGYGAALVLALAYAVLEAAVLVAAGLDPVEHAYSAVVWIIVVLVLLHVGVGAILNLYVHARSWAGYVSAERHLSIQNGNLFWHFATVQGIAAYATIHLFPRLV